MAAALKPDQVRIAEQTYKAEQVAAPLAFLAPMNDHNDQGVCVRRG